MSDQGSQSVDELVAAGRYADAAARAVSDGEPLRAAEIYERIWDFAAAARCRRDGGDLPSALRDAIEARDDRLAAEITVQLTSSGEAGKRSALEVFADRQRHAQAAALAEELGDVERAADLYQRAHLDLDAARLLADLGRDRDAGRLLERIVEVAEAGSERARAHLALGLLLARRMQHGDAARHLQEAARDAETRDRARRALIVELAALGLRDAAREVLIVARVDDPSLPVDVDTLVRAERDDAPSPGDDRDRQMVGGRYRLGKLLGAGASGRVHRAVDEVSEREVAIKLLAGGHSRGEPGYQRFVREARIAQSLRHPNLVEVYDFSADQGFLAMELMHGGSLETRLSEPLSGTAARRLALDVLAGLELAHQRSVIHRDIKPANVFFDARGTAKLGDFGVAHLLDLGQTQTGGLIGTLAYMSPEQITGAPLTIAADFYALGVTVFEALLGRLPFQGPDFVAQHLGEPPPSAAEVARNAGIALAPGWEPILHRLLEKNPDDRFESIGELRAAITALELEVAHRPLVLPRGGAGFEPRSAASSTAIPAQKSAETGPAEARYQFETPIGQTSCSQLSRAVDSFLDRSVILERFREPLPEASERRLFALARGGGPFLQRALSYDRSTAVAVFEAPAGRPIGELAEPLSPRAAARLLERLARAVAPLHEHDRAHGGIDETTVLLDERGHPTVMVSGIPRLGDEPRLEDDVRAILEVVARALGAASGSAGAVLDALVPALPSARRAAMLALPRRTGEELFAFADAAELELLGRMRRGSAA